MFPESLTRFGQELERAIARDVLARRPVRRRRTAARGVAALATAGAIALGVVVLTGDDTPGLGPVADPAAAAGRAAAALAPPAGALVHEIQMHRSAGAGGGESTWREETWRETAPPFRRRSITIRPDGTRIETAAVGAQPAQLYEAATGTIYTDPPDAGPALGTPMPAAAGDPLRAQILSLLRSRDARDVGRVEIGGRDAIRFVYPNAVPGGGHVTWSYLVDAGDFTPIRITAEEGGRLRDTVTFQAYEAASGVDPGLVSLRAAHPGAEVDATEAGYAAALARLFP